MLLNVYGLVVLVALLVDLALGLVGTALNLSALSLEIPLDFASVYSAEDYRRSQAYTKARGKFGMATSVFVLSYEIGFWALGGYGWLDREVQAWGIESSVLVGIAYIGLLQAGEFVLGLPVSLLSTFWLEEKFGFNKTTPKTFVKDRLKAVALAVFIGVPVLAAVLAFFEEAGELAWLYAFAAVTTVSVLLTLLAPVYILPLFLKLEPLEDGELRARIVALAARVEFPIKDIYVVDGSTRSSHSNAFFTGIGANKCICLFDTLVDSHPVEEIVAVVAHEIGHDKLGHTRQGLLINVLHNAVNFYLVGLFLDNEQLAEAFDVDEPSVHVGFVLFSLLYTPVELLLGVLLTAFSRHNEYAADAYSARVTQQPQHLISALKQLSKDNLANLTPHWFHVALNYSHPPVLARCAALASSASSASGSVSVEMPGGGDMKAVV